MAAQTQTVLPSYLRGRWWTPEDPQRITEVADASTGEIVARVSTDGIDIASAVEYGRTVGQRALGELTIHERALKLKELAQHLTEHKQELYDLSYATGATLKDHFFDVDGGIGTLFTFSSKGRRELPNANVIVDQVIGRTLVSLSLAKHPLATSLSSPPRRLSRKHNAIYIRHYAGQSLLSFPHFRCGILDSEHF